MNRHAAEDPWKLWGNTQVRTIAPGSPLRLAPDVNTMCQSRYKRPETWHWLFAARIAGGGSPTVGVQQATATINFQLILGIGRSLVKLPFFEGLNFSWTGGNPVPPSTIVLYTTQTYQARTFPIVLPLGSEGVINQVVAESITVVAEANYITDVPAAVPLQVEISALIAPKVHIRPDWYINALGEDRQFTGAETEGR